MRPGAPLTGRHNAFKSRPFGSLPLHPVLDLSRQVAFPGPWANLPPDLLENVGGQLPGFPNPVSFAGVFHNSQVLDHSARRYPSPPGAAGSLEDLIADTDDGIYLESNRSWSIDDRRLNFQFGTQAGWLIRNGRRTQLVRNPTYTGITPVFWGSCDAIAGPAAWTLWGVPNCGKGEPIQTGHVSHGASPARFRKVQVGVSRW